MSKIQDLIIKDQLGEALDLMLEAADSSYQNTIIQLLGRYNGLQNQINGGTLSADQANVQKNQIRTAAQNVLNDMVKEGLVKNEPEAADPGKQEPADTPHGGKTVFISYNHGDREVANRINAFLKEKDLQVIIDHEAMLAGAGIKDFIEESIAASDVTLSVVSNKSLMSSWVCMETINTLNLERFTDKRFIACFLDDDFFGNNYLLEAVDQIDLKIRDIEEKLPKYAERKLDTTDLNDEKTRLYKLRNNLGDILKKLRGSLSIDVRENKFEPGMEKILVSIENG